jgi:hypothetical protein
VSDFTVNGLTISGDTPSTVEVEVDKAGNFNEKNINISFWDKLKLVSISGNLDLSGNLKDGITDISKEFEAHAEDICIKEEISNNTVEDITKITKNGFSLVRPTETTYPRNGKIGLNSEVDVVYSDFIIYGISVKDKNAQD